MRACVASLALALVLAALVGCGRFASETREPWRRQAEDACLSSGAVVPSAEIVPIAEIDGPGTCGITHPYRVAALSGGAVGLTGRLTLACPIVPEIDRWLARTVQPAAALYLGQPVAAIRGGSYSCRPRNNQSGGKVSEHAFGNALDVMAFRLADGREITVKAGWQGRPEEQDFLREVFVGACRTFTTVLGPGSDSFHHDHLHLDLARHDPAGRRHICRPIIKFDPRLGPDAVASPRRPPPARAALDPDDGDPDSAPAPRAVRPSAAAGAPLQLQPHLAIGAGLR